MRAVLALLSRPDAAVNLAVFRIVVALVLACTPELWAAVNVARLPVAVRTVPTGWSWLYVQLPVTPECTRVVAAIVVVSAVCALVGWWSRTACTVAALGSLYVLGVAQLGGTVVHAHHLVWFAALLAVSPCGDALSVDAWRARRRGQPRPRAGRAHGLALTIACSLLAVIYAFPGFWKLRTSGLAWITSDNLIRQLHWKWLQTNDIPALRLDHLPWLCHVAAAGVVCFELSFPLCVLVRRWRPVAAVGALVFHAGASVWMAIHFSALWLCLVALIDWDALGRRVRRTPPDENADAVTSSAPVWPLAIVGAGLLAGASLAGALHAQNAWPYACYPTFEWIPDREMPALVVDVVQRDGTTRELPRTALAGALPMQRFWGLSWSLINDATPTRVQAWAEGLWTRPDLADGLQDATMLRVWRALLPSDPDAPVAPVSRTLLVEVPTPASADAR